MDFVEWCEEFDRLARQKGYPGSSFSKDLGREVLRDDFNEDVTPQDALNEQWRQD